jgi:hypothetical protein
MWILGDSHDGANWLFTLAELALLFVAVGLMIDYRRLRNAGMWT